MHESGYVYCSKTLTEIRAVAPTTLVVSPSSFVVTSGETVELTATLSSGGDPVPGKLVTWSASDGKTVSPERCTTNSSGRVSTTYAPPAAGVQTWVTITASFAGDQNYFGSSDKSSGAVLPSAEELTEELVVTADRVVMTDGSMKGQIVGSPRVTEITAKRQELTGLYQSRFGITAETFTGDSVVVYATYVRGTAYGETLAWTGDQPIPPAIGLLPKDRVEVENVYLHIARLEAESATLTGMRAEGKQEIYADNVDIYGWGMEGPKLHEGSGSQVTDITASTMKIENLLQVKENDEGPSGWKVEASAVSATGALIYSTRLKAANQLLGITSIVEWEGNADVRPLVKLLRLERVDPLVSWGMEQELVGMQMGSLKLTGLVVKAVENVAKLVADKVPPELPVPPKLTDEFLVTADRGEMSGWSIEGSVDLEDVLGPSYVGRNATKITASQQVFKNMYQSRFETTADNLTATGTTAFATYVQSDVNVGGVRLKSCWKGDGAIPAGLHEFLSDPATAENLHLHIVRMDAGEVELENFRMVAYGGADIRRARLEGWWLCNDYHRGTFKQTSENFMIEDLTVVADDRKHVQTAKSLEGHNLVAYATMVGIHPVFLSPWDPEGVCWVYRLYGDPTNFKSKALRADLVAMEASDLTITDFTLTVEEVCDFSVSVDPDCGAVERGGPPTEAIVTVTSFGGYASKGLWDKNIHWDKVEKSPVGRRLFGLNFASTFSSSGLSSTVHV